MLIRSEQEMLQFGRQFAKKLQAPTVIELLGDVGAGKTTFTRGLAEGLGVQEPLSSPSFTISRRYSGEGRQLVHYDFYRLADPGIMSAELQETIAAPDTITVVEWGESVRGLLPKERYTIEIKYLSEHEREVTVR